ncbi:MAG: hypothetical protein IH945_00375 [Armatimonadetes bacterium]|nr:hypothetical protein [Armatimonadota bacterium]
MRQFQAAGILLLAVMGGCRSSDRTITIEGAVITVEGHRFVADFIPLTFSPDGLLMAGFGTIENVVEVRDVGTGEIVSQFDSDWEKGFPALFSADAESLIILHQDDQTSASFSIPLSGGKMVQLHEVTLDSTNSPGPNYSFTVFAMSNGLALMNDGRLVIADGAIGDAYFDQYGSVWYRTDKGWISVRRDGEVTEHAERPSYLVEDGMAHRGSMHLLKDETTLKKNDAEAYVTAVWLDHDKAVELEDADTGEMVQDRTALIYVGADVITFAFVPNKEIVAVWTNGGLALVPYVVEPREPDKP